MGMWVENGAKTNSFTIFNETHDRYIYKLTDMYGRDFIGSILLKCFFTWATSTAAAASVTANWRLSVNNCYTRILCNRKEITKFQNQEESIETHFQIECNDIKYKAMAKKSSELHKIAL